MTASTLLFLICVFIIGLNVIPALIKRPYPKTQWLVYRIVLFTATVFLLSLLLKFAEIRIKGNYTYPLLHLCFLVSVLLFMATFKNTWTKLAYLLVLFPLSVFCLYNLVFTQRLATYQVGDGLRVSVNREGIMACGESLRLSKSRLLIFEQEVYHTSSICLVGIEKVETVELNDQRVEFHIFHSGVTDSENPYHLVVTNDQLW